MPKKSLSEIFNDGYHALLTNDVEKAKKILFAKVDFKEFCNYTRNVSLQPNTLKFLAEVYPNPNWNYYINNNIKNFDEIIPFLTYSKNDNVDLSKKDANGLSMLANLFNKIEHKYLYKQGFDKIVNNISKEQFELELNNPFDENNAAVMLTQHLGSKSSLHIKDASFILNSIVGESPNASKFYTYLLTNENPCSNFIYNLKEEHTETFIKLSKNNLTNEMVNTVLSNNILLEIFRDYQISETNYEKGINLIKENNFSPLVEVLSEDEQKKIKSLNTILHYCPPLNKKLYLEMVKSKKISINQDNLNEQGQTVFEQILTREIKDIPHKAYDNEMEKIFKAEEEAYLKGDESKEKNSRRRRSPRMMPSTSVLKMGIMMEAKDTIGTINGLIDAGFEPKVSSTTIENLQKLFEEKLDYKNFMSRGYKEEEFNDEILELSTQVSMPPYIAKDVFDFFEKRYGFIPKPIPIPVDPKENELRAEVIAMWTNITDKIIEVKPEEKVKKVKKPKA